MQPTCRRWRAPTINPLARAVRGPGQREGARSAGHGAVAQPEMDVGRHGRAVHALHAPARCRVACGCHHGMQVAGRELALQNMELMAPIQ